ncbi:endopeptidase La [Myxococcota bacterium]|nr:endopeptidase La [Myxococcota bacterium]
MPANRLDLPVIPLRQSVLFPGTLLPVAVARPKSLAVLNALEATGGEIAFVTQRDARVEDPATSDLHDLATVGRVIKSMQVGERGVHLVVEGRERIRMTSVTQTEPFIRATFEPLPDVVDDPLEIKALTPQVKRVARELFSQAQELPAQAMSLLDSIEEPGRLADLVASTLDLTPEEKLSVLGKAELSKRLGLVLELLIRRRDMLKLSSEIDSQVKQEMSKTQREHYLRQQLKAIKEELGEGEASSESDLEALEERLKAAELSEQARKSADKELRRLKNINPASAEYSVARTYLEWLADLPWAKMTTDRIDVADARRVLDERHYGLETVKKRIVEFLAVRKLKDDLKGPILCLVGPPGVGKTSLAQGIAETLNKKLHRISLGGVRDEAEVRGHRRTYVGALPGRMIQGLKKVGTKNPVFVLDEIDKLAHDHHGDPSSALLEVLDPEQNHTFSDHYLEVPFDLSKVMFIATANRLDPIPAPLRDRMEVIEIPGYTHEEKKHIATRHLVPKVLEAHGLKSDLFELTDEALDAVITGYTREAGVRNLERQLANVVRGVAVEVAEGRTEKTVVAKADLEKFLGPERFQKEHAERMETPGVAIGLAWTEVGGDILFIEATKMNGRGQLTLTGQLGDVMKESVQAARSYLRSRTAELGLTEQFWEKTDIHVHVPQGAVPKDGPSAGITMVTALASLVSGIRVKSDVAMTGELTLRGNVLPVGGIKEKVLAAHRAGVKTVIMCERNRKDYVEVPDDVKKDLTVHFVTRIDEVLDVALERPISRVPILPAVPGSTPAAHA